MRFVLLDEVGVLIMFGLLISDVCLVRNFWIEVLDKYFRYKVVIFDWVVFLILFYRWCFFVDVVLNRLFVCMMLIKLICESLIWLFFILMILVSYFCIFEMRLFIVFMLGVIWLWFCFVLI